ncbi:MAG: class III cytochrome C family protein [Bacteroidetes bacterium]|nr:class III cytochrome C family protein [Bacteroidota bacterium]
MKKTIAWGIAAVCIWMMIQFPHAMLNPGELVKGHQDLNQKCLACHNPFWGIATDKCIACHTLSEIGKDTIDFKDSLSKRNKILFHQNLSNTECTLCHTDHKGIKPDVSLSNFSHDLLSGGDASKCNSCHPSPSDNLHKQVSASCNNCHNTKGWKSSVIFNHDMIQGTDTNNCSACHQKPNDSYHNALKDNCNKCHGTDKWIPSTFDHSSCFQLDQNHNATCVTCHTNNNFSAYTCYGCHEHSENNTAGKHIEHGIGNFSNCVSCHKSGNEHDMEGRENSKGEHGDKKEHEGDD